MIDPEKITEAWITEAIEESVSTDSDVISCIMDCLNNPEDDVSELLADTILDRIKTYLSMDE